MLRTPHGEMQGPPVEKFAFPMMQAPGVWFTAGAAKVSLIACRWLRCHSHPRNQGGGRKGTVRGAVFIRFGVNIPRLTDTIVADTCDIFATEEMLKRRLVSNSIRRTRETNELS
jgi:hypothetical protein